MAQGRTYLDEQLVDAVARSTSWRGALRELGLSATSAGAMRSVRRRADHVGADHSHFAGQRRWTDAALRAAVGEARTWPQVVDLLGLEGSAVIPSLKGHAVRLGLQHDHLTPRPSEAPLHAGRPDGVHLSRAGSLLAASWFALCGRTVSWPLEPSRYDLLVGAGEQIRRVQVKTTTVRVGTSWKVYLSTSRRGRNVYDPDEIDDFFVIDGELTCYLIPVAAVGGLHAIQLARYEQYRLPPLALSRVVP